MKRFLFTQGLLFRILWNISQIRGFAPHDTGKILPVELPALDEVVALRAPELGIELLRHRGFNKQLEDICQIGYVDLVPARFACTDDRDEFLGEDYLGEFVCLSAADIVGSPPLACASSMFASFQSKNNMSAYHKSSVDTTALSSRCPHSSSPPQAQSYPHSCEKLHPGGSSIPPLHPSHCTHDLNSRPVDLLYCLRRSKSPFRLCEARNRG